MAFSDTVSVLTHDGDYYICIGSLGDSIFDHGGFGIFKRIRDYLALRPEGILNLAALGIFHLHRSSFKVAADSFQRACTMQSVRTVTACHIRGLRSHRAGDQDLLQGCLVQREQVSFILEQYH